jgi:hypothetical protein
MRREDIDPITTDRRREPLRLGEILSRLPRSLGFSQDRYVPAERDRFGRGLLSLRFRLDKPSLNLPVEVLLGDPGAPSQPAGRGSE